MSALIVRIEGGLGNQLLQYLFGVSLGWRHRKDVLFDVSDYVNGAANRKLALIDLELPGIFIKCRRTINKKKKVVQLNDVAFLRGSTELAISESMVLPLIEEVGIAYVPGLENSRLGYFSGYWQSPLYWDKPAALLSWFNSLLDIVQEKKYPFNNELPIDACAIHIRRGDYLHPDHINWHGICQPSYYTSALNLFQSKNNFFFSDDIGYIDAKYVQTLGYRNGSKLLGSEIAEFLQLRKFKKLATANSSYSYLAGLLASNRYPDAQVVAPYPWYSWSSNGPDAEDKWTLINRTTGRSAGQDDEVVKSSSVTVIVLLDRPIDELNWQQLCTSIARQTVKVDQIFFIGSFGNESERRIADFGEKCADTRVIVRSETTKIIDSISDSTSPFVTIFKLGDIWKPEWLATAIAMSVKQSATLICCEIVTKHDNDKKQSTVQAIASSDRLKSHFLSLFFADRLSILFHKDALADWRSHSQSNLNEAIYDQIVSGQSIALVHDHLIYRTAMTIRKGCQEQVQMQVKLADLFSRLVADLNVKETIKLSVYRAVSFEIIQQLEGDTKDLMRSHKLNALKSIIKQRLSTKPLFSRALVKLGIRL